MARVELTGLSKTYRGRIEALASVDLTIEDGELFVIVGPSGSGKSTLLRLIAGLEAPTAGSLRIAGLAAERLSPERRDVAMVFQTPALYPYLTVFGNLAFGLRARRHPGREIRTRVADVAERLGLTDLLDRYPDALSGGEAQRVALGRAIVRQPRVFLLDEPLSSLDAPLRAALRDEIADLHRRAGTTMIHVTHDQAEALALGDRIAVMDRGRILQVGDPRGLYRGPASRFVAEFLGSPPMNILSCVIEPAEDRFAIWLEGTTNALPLLVSAADALNASILRRGAGPVLLGIRPEHVRRAAGSASGLTMSAPAVAIRVEATGHESIATVAVGNQRIRLRLPAETSLAPGEPVQVEWDPTHVAWFDPHSGASLRD